MVFGKEEKKKAKALLVLHNSFLKAEDPWIPHLQEYNLCFAIIILCQNIYRIIIYFVKGGCFDGGRGGDESLRNGEESG